MLFSCDIVIPCFNSRKFVRDALDSALNQTLQPHAVIIVDDGSSDGSFEMLQEVYSGNSRVKLISHPNRARRGVLASRKLGIEQSESEWIAFLDADDMFLPHKLEHQSRLAQNHQNCILVHGPVQVVYDSCSKLPPWKNEFKFRNVQTEYNLLEQQNWLTSNRICNSTACVKTSALITALSCINEVQLFQYEDWLLWCLLALQGHFLYDPEVITAYRLHPASATAAILDNPLAHHYSYIEFLLKLLITLPLHKHVDYADSICTRFRTVIKQLMLAYSGNVYDDERLSELLKRLMGEIEDGR